MTKNKKRGFLKRIGFKKIKNIYFLAGCEGDWCIIAYVGSCFILGVILALAIYYFLKKRKTRLAAATTPMTVSEFEKT